METWMTEYIKQLEKAVIEYPDEYPWPVEYVPIVAEKMKEAFQKGTFNKDGRAIKATCKVLKIKHTYKDIARFIANHH